jgi:perosamine synthetase
MRLALLGGEPVRTGTFTMEVPQISEEDIEAVSACLEERRLSIFSSQRVREFESAFASYTGTRHAVAVTSGTAALQSAICGANIGPGDEVIVSVYTYAASINAILLQGAVPIFVDVDAHSCVLNGEQIQEVEQAISERTRAIMIVDLFGNVPPRNTLLDLAARRGGGAAPGETSATSCGGGRGGALSGCVGVFAELISGSLGGGQITPVALVFAV